MTTETKTAASFRCLVLYGKSLLAQGVGYLLGAGHDMEVRLVNMEQADLMEATRSTNPDALILDVSNFADLGGFLARLLRELPAMKIVCLDPQASAVYILRTCQRPVENTEEFIATLRAEV